MCKLKSGKEGDGKEDSVRSRAHNHKEMQAWMMSAVLDRLIRRAKLEKGI